jgi:hypothetical protein
MILLIAFPYPWTNVSVYITGNVKVVVHCKPVVTIPGAAAPEVACLYFIVTFTPFSGVFTALHPGLGILSTLFVGGPFVSGSLVSSVANAHDFRFCCS